MTRVSQYIDRIDATFDDPNLVANAGLLAFATLSQRLGLEALIDATVRLVGRVGGARPGRKVLTLVHAIIAGASHIDHVDVLRSGSTERVLGHRVMAPSTIGTFLRSVTFGHVRQLEAVVGRTLERAWGFGAGPAEAPLVIDVDSTICEVAGNAKGGAGYGYTKVLGYAARRQAEQRRAFRKLVRWRTGSEGRINCAKRDFGLNRTRYTGIDGARTWCGHGVFNHNLIKIAALTEAN